jgi:hypothetical protein
MDFDEDDFEVDKSQIFRPDAHGLAETRGLSDTLNKFGYSKDDRIPRREIVSIYGGTHRAMSEEIVNLAHSNRYDEAKEMGKRLTSIRAEFDSMQTQSVANMRESQTKYFNQGKSEILQDLHHRQEIQTSQVNDYIKECEDTCRRHFQIEKDNLELEISRISRPRTKYSKRIIELFKAEHSLINLKQYDDARKVRNMIEKLLPKEEATFQKNFDNSIENKRIKLASRQKAIADKLQEKTKRIEWNNIRQLESQDNICAQRFSNHTVDMNHSHFMESKLRPEMSVKPSHLWVKREHYKQTSAALRGEQLLACARGKKQGEQAFDDKLVDRHDFRNMPMDTVTLRD